MRLSIILLLIFLISFSVWAEPEIIQNPTPNQLVGDSITLTFETPDLVDFGNTTALNRYKYGMGMAGIEYLCEEDGDDGQIDSCWSKNGEVFISSTTVFDGNSSILLCGFNVYEDQCNFDGSADGRLRYDPGGNPGYLTIEGFFSPYLPGGSGENGIFGQLYDGASNYFTVAGIEDDSYYGYNDGNWHWDGTGLYHSNNHANNKSEWNYFEIDGKNENAFMIGTEGTIGVWNSTWTASDVLSGSDTGYVHVSVSTSIAAYADSLKVYNNTPNYLPYSIHAFRIIDTNEFSEVTWFYHGTPGFELIFECGGSTPTQKISTNNSMVECSGGVSQSITLWINNTQQGNITYANISLANSAELSPVEITSYDLTSDGSCKNWNISKENGCTTSDSTPTVVITTDKAAWCGIGRNDLNYSDMNRNDTCLGQGTTELTCTLDPDDELSDIDNYVYIGCQNSNGRENLTSTSGRLKVLLPTMESQGREMIEEAASWALDEGYTIYTQQKVYGRNSDDLQFVGVFDKVIKWMNKIWAINLVAGNDTKINPFNITPVLYTLELNDSGPEKVNSTVYNLIISTK